MPTAIPPNDVVSKYFLYRNISLGSCIRPDSTATNGATVGRPAQIFSYNSLVLDPGVFSMLKNIFLPVKETNSLCAYYW